MDTFNTSPIASKANRRPRTPSSLQEQLVRQLSYLDNSARLYDDGEHHEANRLATTIRVLLHEIPNKSDSHSLLGLLGIREKILYFDTGLYRDRLNAALEEDALGHEMKVATYKPGECGLVELRPLSDGTFGWFAPLRVTRFSRPDDPRARAMREPQSFKSWWSDPVVEASTMRTFSRWNLINIMANQDGGAHVDPAVDQDYVLLCTDHLGVSMQHGPELDGVTISTYDPPKVKYNVAAASVRQIAFELALSINAYLDDHPDVLGDEERKSMYCTPEVPEFHLPMLSVLTGRSQEGHVSSNNEKSDAKARSDEALAEMRQLLKQRYSWNKKR
ncbi:hypothetical protein J2S30_004313 [Herbaspirillum rubrisubalbicans]|uniref:hypothetical protein n=1 Tax=Herbaspirillum rubrisubalbicans TaxID=80842 RepID=UPI00209FFB6D|nr:hypothetical protein [Herbaspirillum rubrisubalbicans]MCP1575934.1 hypothetical protein [Herbaspirillum rubrisubalbicans]